MCSGLRGSPVLTSACTAQGRKPQGPILAVRPRPPRRDDVPVRKAPGPCDRAPNRWQTIGHNAAKSNRNRRSGIPPPESGSFGSGVIFPGFQLQSQGGRCCTWGLFMRGKGGLRLTTTQTAAFARVAFATLNVSQSARTSSLEFYSSSHVPALLWKVGQASTRALLFLR